jgi:hypothetical protein
MKRICIIVGILAILMGTAYAEKWTGNLDQIDQSQLIQRTRTAPALQPQQACVSHYGNGTRPNFQAGCPAAVNEDWEGSFFGPNSVSACAECVSNTNGGGCWPNGELLPGFEGCAHIYGQWVVLTTGFLGVQSTIVGPNYFADDMTFYFEDSTGAGWDTMSPFGSISCTITTYGVGGVQIHQDTITTGVTSPGMFYGVICDQPIERILASVRVTVRSLPTTCSSEPASRRQALVVCPTDPASRT